MLKLTDAKVASGGKSSSKKIIQRSSVRYVRNDLKSYLTKYSFFSSTPLKTKLIDISSQGVQVATTKKLRVNKRLSVNVYFLDGYKFEISGKIVRKQEKNSYLYDLEFESIDHFINTQNATFRRVYTWLYDLRIKTKYRNITSNNIQILTYQEITKKDKIKLVFELSNKETIERKATIIRHRKLTKNHYGIKFDNPNQLLGNYLLKTQKSLIFA